MPDERRTTRVPDDIDPEVSRYARERDFGAPTGLVQAEPLVSVAAGLQRVDRISWVYTDDIPPRGLPCDGFVVFWELGATATPDANPIIVAPSARGFSLFVPGAVQVSYGVAAFRYTYQGQFLGPRATAESWVGSDGGGTALLDRWWTPLSPTPDGTRKNFTIPGITMATDVNGKPRGGPVYWRNGPLSYDTANPPQPNTWTYVGGEIILGLAPDPLDYLAIMVAFGAAA